MKIKLGMILAAGLGKRMQPITTNTPKPLINIGNKSLLESCKSIRGVSPPPNPGGGVTAADED